MLDYLKQTPKIFYKNGVYPIHLTYFVTSRCNARCTHCFYWKELNKPKNELTLEEIKKISKTMPNFLYLLLTGGEPFLRKDLPEVVKIFSTNNKITNIVIPTNGFLTKNIVENTEKILNNTKAHIIIQISIDGLKKHHDKSRGVPGIFDKAIETFKRLKKLKSKYKNLNLGFIMTMFSTNQTILKETYKFLKTLQPDSIFLNIARGDLSNQDIKKIDFKYYKELNNLIREDFRKKELKGFSNFRFSSIAKEVNIKTHEIITKTLETNKYQIPCYAGILDAVLTEHGDLYPCEILSMSLGNLRDHNYNFKKLWNSKKAKEIRKHIKNTKCFCTHECFINTNVLFNPKNLPSFIKTLIKRD